MKTGFDIFNTDNDQDNNDLNILSLLTVFMENAVENAAIYTKHSNRTIITSYDISLALKREVFEFLNCENLEDRAKKILEEYIDDILNEEENDEEDDEEEDDEEEDDEENSEDKEKKNINNDFSTDDTEDFKESLCKCNICSQINKYKDIWKNWKPSNKIEEILYNGIIKIDNDFNLH